MTMAHMRLARPKVPVDGLDKLVARFGAAKVARLVWFAYEWKFDEWNKTRSNADRIPDLSLARAAFSRPSKKLYRGVMMPENSRLWRAKEGDEIELKLPNRSISSWTTSYDVALSFCKSNPEEAGAVISLASSDAVLLSVPANIPDIAPQWYTALYYSLTDAYEAANDMWKDAGTQQNGLDEIFGFEGDIDPGEEEYIISMSHARIRIEEKTQSEFEREPTEWTPELRAHERTKKIKQMKKDAMKIF